MIAQTSLCNTEGKKLDPRIQLAAKILLKYEGKKSYFQVYNNSGNTSHDKKQCLMKYCGGKIKKNKKVRNQDNEFKKKTSKQETVQ